MFSWKWLLNKVQDEILFLATSVLLGHGPNKAFLVPDSCRATEWNGNSVTTDVTDDTIEND
jgi:hypothetical protein